MNIFSFVVKSRELKKERFFLASSIILLNVRTIYRPPTFSATLYFVSSRSAAPMRIFAVRGLSLLYQLTVY